MSRGAADLSTLNDLIQLGGGDELSVSSRLPSHVVDHSVVLNACLCFCNVKLHFQHSSLVKTVATVATVAMVAAMALPNQQMCQKQQGRQLLLG